MIQIYLFIQLIEAYKSKKFVKQAFGIWIGRLCTLIFHYAIYFLSRRFPRQLYEIHGPIVLLSQMPLYFWHSILYKQMYDVKIMSLWLLILMIFSLMQAFAQNTNWIMTISTMLIVTISTIAFFAIEHNFKDIMSFIPISLILFIMLY